MRIMLLLAFVMWQIMNSISIFRFSSSHDGILCDFVKSSRPKRTSISQVFYFLLSHEQTKIRTSPTSGYGSAIVYRSRR